MSITCLPGDEVTEVYPRNVKSNSISTSRQEKIHVTSIEQTKKEESKVRSIGSLSEFDLSSYQPICRKFWSCEDFGAAQDHQVVFQSGQNRLRVHPKFLHSNATSHKWAFGAMAELIDNAVDEVTKGATFVYIDKTTNPRNGTPALLIQDDGSGMDPESLRSCMSFGFSNKQISCIGQYGNGFKTSTMRLGADVIVFSRCCNGSNTLTQSVGLLSYTFLIQTGYDDIVVPMVDYNFNPSTGALERLLRRGQKEFSANLSTILQWSPFATEAELLKHFDKIGNHGTKVIVYNLWYDDEGHMELDFEADPLDILIGGEDNSMQTKSKAKLVNQNHISNRFRYSLRVYSSVLYLHRAENFRIILRGQEVEHHYLVKELKYYECILYKPQVGGRIEGEVITTIGYLNGAPDLNTHGFNIYHKNRLILPFCPIVSSSSSKGRGVVGVLEANFIKPTHDKQGFEKSILYQKLETRLKEMTNEYWDTHCHLLGYYKKPLPSSSLSTAFVPPQLPYTKGSDMQASISRPSCSKSGNFVRGIEMQVTSSSPSCSNSGGFTPDRNTSSHAGKRRQESEIAEAQPSKKQLLFSGLAASIRNKSMSEVDGGKMFFAMKEINKKLNTECSQLEERENELLLKGKKIRQELEEVQRLNDRLLLELKLKGVGKVEKQ